MTEHDGRAADGKAREEFVERFAAELVGAGMARMPARVFVALLASERGALTSAELSERLRISPAAVSGAVRYLSQVDLVVREREPGTRRERYRVHEDLWYQTFTNRDRLVRRYAETIRLGIAAVGEDTEAGHRLAETAAFFDFFAGEIAQLRERWHTHRDTLRARGELT